MNKVSQVAVVKDALPKKKTFTNLQLASLIATKTILNSTIRFLFPFVIFFAESMNISQTKFALTILIAAEISSVVAPPCSQLASRYSNKRICTISTFAAGLTCLLNLCFPLDLGSNNFALAGVFVLRIGFGINFNLINSAIQSSVASNVLLKDHGKITGIVESSWTIGGFSFSVIGWLLARYGWKGPFLLMVFC